MIQQTGGLRYGGLRRGTGLRIRYVNNDGLALRMMSFSRQRPRGTALLQLVVLGAGVLCTQAETWKFAFFSDTISLSGGLGINTNTLAEIATALAGEKPDVVLFGGDFGLSPSAEVMQCWTNLMAPVTSSGAMLLPAAGNHDLEDGFAAFTNTFRGWFPANGPAGDFGCTYAVRFKNALFVVLNECVSNRMYQMDRQWLDSVLATNAQPHVFVVGHVPAFKLYHTESLGLYPAERNAFWNSLSNAHCRVYLCGHDHFYEHARLDDGDGDFDNDVHQFTVGTGGAPLVWDGAYDGDNGLWTPTRVFHEAQNGYLTMEIDDDYARAVWHHRVGVNSYEIGPDVFAYTVGPRPMLQLTNVEGNLALTWPGKESLQASADMGLGFTNVPGAKPPFRVSLDSPRMFYRLAWP